MTSELSVKHQLSPGLLLSIKRNNSNFIFHVLNFFGGKIQGTFCLCMHFYKPHMTLCDYNTSMYKYTQLALRMAYGSTNDSDPPEILKFDCVYHSLLVLYECFRAGQGQFHQKVSGSVICHKRHRKKGLRKDRTARIKQWHYTHEHRLCLYRSLIGWWGHVSSIPCISLRETNMYIWSSEKAITFYISCHS